MLPIQQTIPFSDYSDLYDLIIPQDNLLRMNNDLVDFSFIQKELMDQYCQDNDRMTESPVMMFIKVRFLAMAKLKQVWLCSFGLTKSFLKVRFLAMAKLKQVWLCSFGLTKSFIKQHHSSLYVVFIRKKAFTLSHEGFFFLIFRRFRCEGLLFQPFTIVHRPCECFTAGVNA